MIPEITITLKGYISKSAKNKTKPNNKKIVDFLWTEIFLNEYVGTLLINNKAIATNKNGTAVLLEIVKKEKPLIS